VWQQSILVDTVQTIQTEVWQRLEEFNAKYKKVTERQQRAKVFQEWELVIVYLCQELFQTGPYNKLKSKKYGPFRVLMRINDNVYIVDLPKDMAISPTFNAADIFEYHRGRVLSDLGRLTQDNPRPLLKRHLRSARATTFI
jgi:hypothetical protein